MSKIKVHTIDIYQDSATGDKYQINPDGTYTQISTRGAANVYQADSAVPFPESWSADFSYTGTIAALGTTSVIDSYSKGTLVISGLTTETVSVTGLIGTNQNVATAALRLIDLNTGALAAASALGNGSYKLVDMAVHKLVFTKSSTVDNATVTITLKA